MDGALADRSCPWTEEWHAIHLLQTVTADTAGIKFYPDKCRIKNPKDWGRVVSSQDAGVGPCPKQGKAVQKWQLPTNKQELQHFQANRPYHSWLWVNIAQVLKIRLTLLELLQEETKSDPAQLSQLRDLIMGG